MIFKSQNSMVLHYMLIIGIIFLIIIAIILIIRKKTYKKLMIPVCAVLAVLVGACIFNSYHYGIKKIVFPVIKGDNEYTTKTEIKGYLKWLNSLKLQEVEYDMKHDPGMLSGSNGGVDIIYNNGDIECNIYNGVDYLLVIKEGKKKLYHVIK